MSWFEKYRLFGDYHASEIPFVFRNEVKGRVFNESDWEVSDALSSYWTNLATTHDPNDGLHGVPLTWPRYSESLDENLQVCWYQPS